MKLVIRPSTTVVIWLHGLGDDTCNIDLSILYGLHPDCFYRENCAEKHAGSRIFKEAGKLLETKEPSRTQFRQTILVSIQEINNWKIIHLEGILGLLEDPEKVVVDADSYFPVHVERPDFLYRRFCIGTFYLHIILVLLH